MSSSLSDSALRLIPGEDPDAIVAKAVKDFSPIATFCLFSGGGDSQALALRCRDHYEALVFIDTGTAIPGVIEHVREFASWIGKPLHEMREYEDDPFQAYRNLVLGTDEDHAHVPNWKPLGFPGPGQHGRAYNRLKERQIERLLRETKAGQHRYAKVLFLTGVRRAESQRRAKRASITQKRGMIYANPLIDWGNAQTRIYRDHSGAPASDVAALMHRSGECNCGAFAVEHDERAMLKSLWPAWWARIEALEDEAEAAGVQWCRWGGFDVNGERAGGDPDPAGELCTSCELRLFEEVPDAA